MELILLFILIALLGVVVFQDFKSKEISWFLIPLLFIGFTINALLQIEPQELVRYFGINLAIVVINLIGVTILISLKEKKMTNMLNTYLGLGDVLFFFVLTVVFSPFNFVFFYLGSILLTTIIYAGIIAFNQQKKTLIPLAGAMSLGLIITLITVQFTSNFNLYQDLFIIE